MSGGIQMKPAGAKHPCLQADDVRERQHQEPARAQKIQCYVQDVPRVVQVFENMKERDSIQAGGRKVRLIQCSGLQSDEWVARGPFRRGARQFDPVELEGA